MTHQDTNYLTLYRLAFERFHTIALWNMTPLPNPTPADALAITRALRTHAGLEGRRLAEQIEQAAHASTFTFFGKQNYLSAGFSSH